MYSSTTPSYSVDRVNNRTLALENGLRASNAPQHAIDRIYAESGEQVSFSFCFPYKLPFPRSSLHLLEPKKYFVTVGPF